MILMPRNTGMEPSVFWRLQHPLCIRMSPVVSQCSRGLDVLVVRALVRYARVQLSVVQA